MTKLKKKKKTKVIIYNSVLKNRVSQADHPLGYYFRITDSEHMTELKKFKRLRIMQMYANTVE